MLRAFLDQEETKQVTKESFEDQPVLIETTQEVNLLQTADSNIYSPGTHRAYQSMKGSLVQSSVFLSSCQTEKVANPFVHPLDMVAFSQDSRR